jgi:hypothetical protein
VNCYQLSCGHWQTDRGGYEIGSHFSCIGCGHTRRFVIGFSASQRVMIA